MAISPDEVMKRLAEGDAAQVASMEEMIDEWLLSNMSMNDGVAYLPLDRIEKYSGRVRDRVIGRYRDAGWSVQFKPGMTEAQGSYAFRPWEYRTIGEPGYKE